MSVARNEGILKAILDATPPDEHDAVCAAWEGLMPDRRDFLSNWPPPFIAGWLRGLVSEWDDNAPINALPEGGYARRVLVTDASGTQSSVWCRVASPTSSVGEVIHCDDVSHAAGGSRLAFRVAQNGTAVAMARG